MRRRSLSVSGPVLASMLTCFAACGGRVDDAAQGGSGTSLPTGDSVSEPTAPSGPSKPSAPKQVAADVGIPSAIAIADPYVVFTTRATRLQGALVEAGGLFIAHKLTGPALMISLDRRGATFDALAVDKSTAYVATSDARLLRVPILGGEPSVLAELPVPAVTLARGGDFLFYVTEDGTVGRVPAAGGAAQALGEVSGAARALAVDGGSVYIATTTGASGDEDAPAEGEGTIVRFPEAGGTPTVLATTKGAPCAMVMDQGALFWTTLPAGGAETKGTIFKLSLLGGAPASVSTGTFAACALAADQRSLFFATTTADAVDISRGQSSAGVGLMRAPIAGGEPVRIEGGAKPLTHPGSVTVDDTFVYWLTESAVLRLAK